MAMRLHLATALQSSSSRYGDAETTGSRRRFLELCWREARYHALPLRIATECDDDRNCRGSAGPPVAVRQVDELEQAFAAAARDQVEGMVVLTHGFAVLNRTRIMELAARQRLPVLYGWREFAEEGGLMSYGPDIQVLVRQAATYVDRILKGEKPSNLPVQQPTKFELVINLKTAKALGLTVPDTLLVRADEVIE
jgi:putative tryptophan/tyrosine transport system substrate-binding protein